MADLGPQTVVREFCQADAVGARASIQGWPRIAPLVEWPLEPAWDRVALITSYTVGWPLPAADETLAVEVRYLLTAWVTAKGVDEKPQVESIVFRVRAQGTAWHVVGPPPPPHIFAQRTDAQAMQRSLANGGVNFLPNSLFVWQMFRSAGWNVAPQLTADLLTGGVYRSVPEPKTGDLVVYLRDGIPYHTGLLEASGQVVSSTLNAGIMRAPIDAFAGAARYLRLVQPAEVPPTAATTPDTPSAEPASISPKPAATLKPSAVATPTLAVAKKHKATKPGKKKAKRKRSHPPERGASANNQQPTASHRGSKTSSAR